MITGSAFGKNDNKILFILFTIGLIMLLLIQTLKAQSADFSKIPYSWIDPDREGNNSQDISAQSADDAIFVLSLPFTFNFNGKGYTECFASTNGTLSFEKPFGDYYQNSETSQIPLIAAYWDDLFFEYNCAASTWKYETTGITPGRCFIVTWNSFIRNDGSCGNTVSFQARLYENEDSVEVSISQNTLSTAEKGNVGIFFTNENTGINYNSEQESLLWSGGQTQNTSAYLK